MKHHLPLLTLLSGIFMLGGCSMFVTEKKPARPVKHTPALDVMITEKMASAKVKHSGKSVTIVRIQNEENRVNENFAKTSRICPPFCIQPASLGHGIETVGELEVIKYAVKISKGKKSLLLVDARSPEWQKLGTIPGSVNIPYSKLNREKGASDIDIVKAMKQLGVRKSTKGWNFKRARTVVLFSNGMWSDQASAAIEGLLKEGYPEKKIKWYRGGMQSWEILGLTVVKPKEKDIN